jgi:hypothetical protein
MRKILCGFVGCCVFLALAGFTRSGEDRAAREIIDKAILAGGGEAKLAKFESAIMKEKGTYYGMGDGLPYTSVVHMKRPDRFKMEVKGVFTICLDGDKGWMKSDKAVTDLPKEELEVQQLNQKAGWIMSLLPLKDKAYKLKIEKNGGKDALVEVTRKDYPTVRLYFDTKAGHLIKSQFKTKSQEQKYKEVMAEFQFSDFKTVDGVTVPHHVVLKHDGKLFVEADVTEIKAAKLDNKVFARPGSD